MINPIRYEPVYPPAWSTEEMQDIEEEYEEVPRGLEPSGPCT